jgi:hypothetical protein
MKRLLTFVFALGLTLSAFAFPAEAAPAFAQAPQCLGAPTTQSFGAAPATGDVVANDVLSVINSAGFGFVDSNAFGYPQVLTSTAGTAVYATVFDSVIGTPVTGTYTYNGGAQFNANCMYDISGVTYPGTYQAANSTTSGSTLTATIVGAKAGDVLICTVYGVGTVTGVTSNNSTLTTDLSTGGVWFLHGIATATTSTTCTATVTTSGLAIAMGFIDYTSGAAAAPAPSLFPYPKLFEPA